MWFQLQIEQYPRDSVEQFSEMLQALGAVAISLTDAKDNPVLEPAPGTAPLWPEVSISALYQNEEMANATKELLAHQYPELPINLAVFADQDWLTISRANLEPQCFGNNLWVCPSWITPPQQHAVNVILDPGLAFGTGTHPTTSLCLSWLAQTDVTNKTLIDFGCGSGILSLAALKLGAKQVQAIDIDEQALQATLANARTNFINEQQLQAKLPQQVEGQVDFLLANILLTPLLELRSRFSELLKNNGKLVVSGILVDQVDELIGGYQKDFVHQSTDQLDNWSLLTFTKKRY